MQAPADKLTWPGVTFVPDPADIQIISGDRSDVLQVHRRIEGFRCTD
jgi:hypothetical protein